MAAPYPTATPHGMAAPGPQNRTRYAESLRGAGLPCTGVTAPCFLWFGCLEPGLADLRKPEPQGGSGFLGCAASGRPAPVALHLWPCTCSPMVKFHRVLPSLVGGQRCRGVRILNSTVESSTMVTDFSFFANKCIHRHRPAFAGFCASVLVSESVPTTVLPERNHRWWGGVAGVAA